MTSKLSVPHVRLTVIGLLVLLAGLTVGSVVYWHGQPDADPTDAEVLQDQEQSRMYQLEVERNVGTFGLLMSRFSETLGKLTQPRPLGITIILASSLTACGFFFVASRK